jgi:hypothetical protein
MGRQQQHQFGYACECTRQECGAGLCHWHRKVSSSGADVTAAAAAAAVCGLCECARNVAAECHWHWQGEQQLHRFALC